MASSTPTLSIIFSRQFALPHNSPYLEDVELLTQ
jgi:hypothetical protein